MRVSLTLVAALCCASVSSADPTYQIGPIPTNQGPGFNNPIQPQTSGSPVGVSGTDSVSTFNYTVNRRYELYAGPGLVRSSSLTSANGSMPTGAVTFLRSSFMTDDTVLAYTGPTIPSITLAVEIDGVIDATRTRSGNSASGEVVISVHLAGQTQSGRAKYTTSGTLTTSGLLSGVGQVIDETLQVTFTNVPANVPISMGLTLDALTGGFSSSYNATGKSLFGNTFNLNTTGDVFTTSDPGFTNANAPSINLIDNSYAIPEPTAAALLAIGGMALMRRRR